MNAIMKEVTRNRHPQDSLGRVKLLHTRYISKEVSSEPRSSIDKGRVSGKGMPLC